MGADKFSESEWETRKTRIEPKLRSAGWDVVPFDAKKTLADYHCCAIEEYPTSAGPADYALCFNGHILGVIEAKRLSLGPQNVLTQAERYSRGASSNPLNFNGYHIPFLYSTNGEIIWRITSKQLARNCNKHAMTTRGCVLIKLKPTKLWSK